MHPDCSLVCQASKVDRVICADDFCDLEHGARCAEAVIRIGVDNAANMIPDPNGTYPRCKREWNSMRCCRCGRGVAGTEQEACPAVPPEKRWRFKD